MSLFCVFLLIQQGKIHALVDPVNLSAELHDSPQIQELYMVKAFASLIRQWFSSSKFCWDGVALSSVEMFFSERLEMMPQVQEIVKEESQTLLHESEEFCSVNLF